MDTNALVGLVRARKITVEQAVHETSIQDLDEVLPMLKRCVQPRAFGKRSSNTFRRRPCASSRA